ncbi:hypothetical protein Poli38472_001857 [Pythium oligandrum]|uniref:Uncharacterized protein n=1 Tax=Pythium oligandrum TaxID=41045 RepID=A0A8K1CW47_PYTOL|nr:hypothetical protein Poli38472_001857 [Pythium oligandrum]|eukprot:TMW69701.1 hypothetical protein Poli38472_001857 [Pythium oligandrum]
MNDAAIAAAPTTPDSTPAPASQAQRLELLQEQQTKLSKEQKLAPVRKLEEQKKRQAEVTRATSECTKKQRQAYLDQQKAMLPQHQHKLRRQEAAAAPASVGQQPGAMLSSAPSTLLSTSLTGTTPTATITATGATASTTPSLTSAQYHTFKLSEQLKQRLTAQPAKLREQHQRLIMAQPRARPS